MWDERERQARRDPLSPILNRRVFEELQEREGQHPNRTSAPLAVTMFDLDHFKEINVAGGHQTGVATLDETPTRRRATSPPWGVNPSPSWAVRNVARSSRSTDQRNSPGPANDDVAPSAISHSWKEIVSPRRSAVAARAGSSDPHQSIRLITRSFYEDKNVERNRVKLVSTTTK